MPMRELRPAGSAVASILPNVAVWTLDGQFFKIAFGFALNPSN